MDCSIGVHCYRQDPVLLALEDIQRRLGSTELGLKAIEDKMVHPPSMDAVVQTLHAVQQRLEDMETRRVAANALLIKTIETSNRALDAKLAVIEREVGVLYRRHWEKHSFTPL